MNMSCETCEYSELESEQYPCCKCSHNYITMYKKENFTSLIEPLKRLTRRQIYKGNTIAQSFCDEIIDWIEEVEKDFEKTLNDY